MEGVLTRHVCNAHEIQDMVELNLGDCRILMFYQTAFSIAAGILQAATQAARFEGIHPRNRVEMSRTDRQQASVPLSPDYRRSTSMPNFKTWKVAFDGKLVVLTFDQREIRLPYDHAFKLYGWVRVAAKDAKRWSGDTSRQWSIRAALHDAEDNDKFVYVQ